MAAFDSKNFVAKLDASAAYADQQMALLLPDDGGRLHTAMRYAALSPGKKLRAFLVMESAALFGLPRESAVRTATALECLHCYSLIHDDLPAMDNDDLRRGLPTLHRKFDEATAILAGDALLTFAFEILAEPATHKSAAIRAELVLQLAKASGESGMVGGQMLDIEAETRNFDSLAEISSMQSRKTGALISFACVAGAILAGADPAPLRNYAQHLGLAFQIADDILDVESTPADLGKATQKDAAKGKATFVDFLGLQQAKRRATELAGLACDELAGFDSKADTLRETAHYVVTRRK